MQRGHRISDHLPVIIKSVQSLEGDGSTYAERIRHEHTILQRLAENASPLLPRCIDFVAVADSAALVLEDIGATAVRVLNSDGGCSTRDALRIGRHVAAALSLTHRSGFVHGDVNPNNIVVNPTTDAAQLIDFGAAVSLTQAVQLRPEPQRFAGTLRYSSPEQLGRTSRAIDQRSDLYSLGATLYELLCGKPAFSQTEPADLVYAVLTQLPVDPLVLRPTLPRALGDIVLKLLSKDPEQRYMSAHGLQEDLELCMRRLAQNETHSFELATQDRNETFKIGNRLYGREQQLAQLQSCFRASTRGACKMVVIAGPSGIGKSSLIHAMQPTLTQERAFLGMGKHDLLGRHIPFSALGQALGGIVRTLLAAPPEELALWEKRLGVALGNVGQALVDICPMIERLVGPQKPLMHLGPRESENRFFMLTLRFLQALSKEQPVVLFIDDLQAADAGTLKLLPFLQRNLQSKSGVLLIAACRDNELIGGASLSDWLAQLEDGVESMSVAPLTQDSIAAFLAEVTRTSVQKSMPLAQVVLAKTQGNPFFVHEFLYYLNGQGLLKYRVEDNCWTWSLTAVAGATATQNVVDLLTDKLAQLNPVTRQRLGEAACFHTAFSPQQLMHVSDLPLSEVEDAIAQLLSTGFLLPAHDKSMDGAAAYTFAHDRLRQAAYDSISPEHRLDIHLKIGQNMARELTQAPAGRQVLAMVGHLNQAHERLSSDAQRQELAEWNLQASREAKRSSAWTLAADYARRALSLLNDAAWKNHPNLHRELQLELADSDYLLGDLQAAEKRLGVLLAEAVEPLQRAAIQQRRITLAALAAQHGEALSVGVTALRELGFPLRVHGQAAKWSAVLNLRAALRGQSIPGLLHRPECRDANATMALEILATLFFPAFVWGTESLVPLVFTAVALTARYGNTTNSAFHFSCMAQVLGMQNRLVEARQYANLALDMLKERDDQRDKGGTVNWAYSGVLWLEMSPADVLQTATEACVVAQEAGTPLYAMALVTHITFAAFSASLDKYNKQRERYARLASIFPQTQLVVSQAGLFQCMKCLQGRTPSPTSLADTDFSQEAIDEYLATHRADGGVASLTMNTALVSWLHGDTEGAYAAVMRSSVRSLFAGATQLQNVFYCFYACLILIQHSRHHGRRRVRDRRIFKRAYARLVAAAKVGEPARRALPVLISAEMAALQGQHRQAMERYATACTLLRQSGYRLQAAMALECAGRFWTDQGEPTAAQAYMQQAHDGYLAWGATRKAKTLKSDFLQPAENSVEANLSAKEGKASSTFQHDSGSHTGLSSPREVNMEAVLQCAHAIAGEVQLEPLVAQILKSLQQVAGATRAALLLKKMGGGLELAADSASQGNDELPQGVLQSVARSHEPLTINDISNESTVQDPYLRRCSARSLLCVPIIHRSELRGVAYLENNLATHVFYPAMLSAVTLLAAQAAIALENAAAGADMEALVSQRTLQWREAQKRLVEDEREETEMKMAGGFAHEMRNALGAVTMPLQALYNVKTPLQSQSLHGLLSLAIEGLTQQLTAYPNDEGLQRALQQLCDYQSGTREMLDVMHRGLERGIAITQQILDFSQTGQIRAGDESTSFDQVIARVLREKENSFAQEHITVETHVPANLQGLIREEHAFDIIRNLIANAHDAVVDPSVERPRHIEIQADRSDHDVIISVKDNGVGMPSDVQKKVFEPFYSTKGAHGTGLGLGMARKLAHIYGGRINFVSEENSGTTFTLRIPYEHLRRQRQ